MKKRILSALLVLVMVVTMIPAFAIASTAASDRDQTWYSDTAGAVFEISTASQLLGFSDLLAEGKTFAGQTIKLDEDIILNEYWSVTAIDSDKAVDQWAALPSNVTFNGIFDGQNHTISGAYMYNTVGNVGLFGRLNGGKVKNVSIVNSYVRGAGQIAAITGLVNVGTSGNVISNVYCDVYIETIPSASSATDARTGGIVGVVGGETTIENCVFAGTIDGIYSSFNNNTIGGLVGRVSTNTGALTMSNSAFYGNIDTTGNKIGGLIGEIGNEGVGNVTVTNCISGGTRTAIGNVAAAPAEGKAISVTNCYCTQEQNTFNSIASCTISCNKIDNPKEFSVVGTTLTEFKDVAGGYPRPTSMNTMRDGKHDRITGWFYTETDKNYTITSAGELLGFSDLLVRGNNFSGWTITLGADIDLNENWTVGATPGTNAPANRWASIRNNTPFNGTFDGQGHTVSGAYMKSAYDNGGLFGRLNGGKVQNLVIVNSYIEGKNQCGAITGLINVGSTGNVISNVYVDAYVKTTTIGENKTVKVGGLVGVVGGTTTIENCVFAGTIDAGTHNTIGGLVAHMYTGAPSLTLSNSASCGEIITTGGTVGGIIALVDKSITAENCISAGNLIGGASAAATMNNCYYVEDQAELANVTLNKCTQVTDEELASPTATVPAGFTAMPEGYPMPTTLANTVWAQDKNATTVFYGYQENETTNTEIRLVGLVNVEGTPSDTIKSVGFDVEMILENGNTWTNNNEAIYNLYTSVVTPSGTKTATELEGDYIFVATVSGIKADYNKDITFVVKTFYETTAGEIVYNDILVFTYNPAANA